MNVEAVSRREYEDLLRDAARDGLSVWQRVLDDWKSGERFSALWGYNPPMQPIRLAGLIAYLRSRDLMDSSASRSALEIVRAYSGLRGLVPESSVASRAETREGGLPLFVNFFLLPVYAEICADLRAAGDLGTADMAWLEEQLPPVADLLFSHAEWGAMNRAILRADGLDLAADVLPQTPQVGRWRQMAESLASDSIAHWEIEDASTYHPVWMFYLLRYLERRGTLAGLTQPHLRWYIEFFLSLLAPHGTIPDFGDGEWRSTAILFVPIFELAGARTGDPRFRWAAARVFRSCIRGPGASGLAKLEVPWELTSAHRWVSSSAEVQCPVSGSQEALDEAIGKKIVFRDGWEPSSTYMLLNYMDEGNWGWLDRRYLRETISVEEEKMHHGHADENSIAFLMSGGSLLLHDAGYRDALPSGKFGAFRADYFHNRLVVRTHKLDKGQDLFESLRNSGGHHATRTEKVDFQKLLRCDYSRTRLVDETRGYLWDRTVAYVRDAGWFLVIDGFLPLREEYFTAACLWHTQVVHSRGAGRIVGGYRSMGSESLPQDRRLLIEFIGERRDRLRGEFALPRHYAEEIAFYEAESRHFLAGRWSVFATRLVVLEHGEHAAGDGGDVDSPAVEILPTNWGQGAICLRVSEPTEQLFFVKLDVERERADAGIRPRTSFEAGAVMAGPLLTDAHFAHVWNEPAGMGYSATLLTRLLWEDRVVMEVPRNTFGLQLDGAPDRESRARWRRWEKEAGA